VTGAVAPSGIFEVELANFFVPARKRREDKRSKQEKRRERRVERRERK